MKKIVVDVLLIVTIIISLTCFGLLFDTCQGWWQIYYEDLQRDTYPQKFIDADFAGAIESTAILIMLALIAIICIIIFILVNKRDFEIFKESLIENHQKKKTLKQTQSNIKAEQEKQKRIDELQTELNLLKKDE